jgi:PAS domain S-box-containing protein
MAATNPCRLEAIFNSAVDYAIVATDCDGRITDWSEGAHRILGWTAKEACGEDIDLFFTPKDRAEGRSRLEMTQTRMTGHSSDERWHVRKDGERFWASGEMMPLIMPDGMAAGFVKVLRDRTQQRLDAERLRDRDQILLRNEERLQMALNASGAVGLWDWSEETDRLHGDAQFARLYGLDPARAADGITLEEHYRYVVPDDLPQLREKVQRLLEQGGEFLAEYRVAVPGEPLRWLECKGRVVRDGDRAARRFSGTTVDITARKQAEQLKHLLMEELSHRVKNMFTMVQAIVAQTLRSADGSLVDRLTGRLIALSRAHEILMQTNWNAADLSALIVQALQIDSENAHFDLDGPPMAIGARAALSLSLLLHEMATNAIKYGALSVPGGIVRLQWEIKDEQFCLRWIEEGGPPAREPARKGFGSRLIAMGIAGAQQATLDYGEPGLRAEFRANMATMSED